MELKAVLEGIYTEEDKFDFITEQNRIKGYQIVEEEGRIEAWGYSEEEETSMREENFKSQFFEIQGYNWYRKKPKGYTSALESLNVAYNMITSGAIQELPAGTFIFYPQPDFSKPEQCTEEWLVAHQILSEAMTAQQFIQFYATFVVAWNTEMHENSLEGEE